MSEPLPDPDAPTAAERQLVRLLGVVRADPPIADAALTSRVVRSVRWQHALRGALQVGGWMATAATEVVSLLAGRDLRGRRPDGER